ncbi:MAG: bifunctional (p)ppGpp synthetase/guanosine-3',5'-bis(diphosphate) 3'-pyrophosphohydrolase [Bacteroidaceae bacterium]|nr:bifunctional (p)ppGpp synthetase/guanosine-3',5'-bis(diphosphate) 3'-pyrophosphohydrolase [Bacteroidaceae bacterium]MBR6846088.1 bifunctional (p)ppGpp synthetase/guanosine-3',5'-bis(diphosphate) 3'-pyrophosphohydrolase [Bacteroidaceae bacterium]MCR5334715.1 RelA/SpoT family protein [Bacteroidaceae bacterium]
MIEAAYRRLVDTYLDSPHRKKVDLVEKAFNFAREAHEGVCRLSGEPYIMHPLAVAQIVCGEIGLGSTSICAALLHDVVEDTDYTVEDIRNIFGPKIAQIVDGVTKISGGIFGSQASAQAETFKKLLLTMSEDIRVILIKISDRLHNMRTLGSQLPAKQKKIAGETLYIYAPLANRLGLNRIKEELEDLSFKHEHPEEYSLIVSRIADRREHLNEMFTEFTAPIRERLDKTGLKYEVKARIKTPYSIWNKMQTKHVTFEEIYDILAARIIFEGDGIEQNETAECWRIYATASNIYKPHPERLRDWLSHPKANGYQALQCTLMSKSGQWVELQIRSRRMDDIAEHGFAAHWKYKEGGKTSEDSENELEKWLSTIKEILDDPQPNAMDFLDAIKLNLYASEIFVVTPKGDFKTMPAGSTVLDFAFSVHTFLGTHCIGAKVNHHLVPLSYKLESGDQVEVMTGRNPQTTPEWLQWATTAKARTKIQAILRRRQREAEKQGEHMLSEFLRSNEMEFSAANLDRLYIFHNVHTREEMFSLIAAGTITLGDDDLRVLRNKSGKRRWRKYIPFLKRNSTEQPRQIVEEKKQDVAPWLAKDHDKYQVGLQVEGSDGVGVLHEITGLLSGEHSINIRRLNVESKGDKFIADMIVEVEDLESLQNVMNELKQIPSIDKLVRLS